jgi:Ni,Fe-hydrogenase III large subunit
MENEGEGLGRVESPSGDLTYLIKLNEGKINEISMLTPSKVNLPVFLNSTRGNVFTDFHFNWESFGIWISEIAVGFI